jgi:hypothetical protein
MSKLHRKDFINVDLEEQARICRLYHGFDRLRPVEIRIPKECYDSNGNLIPNGLSYFKRSSERSSEDLQRADAIKYSGSDKALQNFLGVQFMFDLSYDLHPAYHLHFASGPAETSVHVTWARSGPR